MDDGLRRREVAELSSSIVHRPSSPLRSILVLTVLALTWSGCDFSPEPVRVTPRPTSSPVPPTATRPPQRTGGTLTIRLAADAGSLNPWLSGRDQSAQSVAGLVFGGLTRLDNHLQPQPDLAESWDVSEDGTALTFHLRQGVEWHDGRPFTAEDVVWSYRTLARLRADTPALLHIQETVSAVEAVEPLSYTVRFSLKRRYSPLLADLAMPVLPSHILSGTEPDTLAEAPFNQKPVGTGPFAFQERQPNQSITLKSNERYYGGQPSIDRVAFLVAPDDKVAEDALKSGSLMIGQFPPEVAERLVGAGGGIRGGSYNEQGYDFVAFNLRPPRPFSDTRLRKAWAWALDKPGLVFAATGGSSDPVYSDVSKASWAYNPVVPQYGGNPEEARKLLSEAGWVDTNGDGIVEKDGKALEVSLYVRSDSPVRRKAADSMAEQLGRAGIRVKVEPADFGSALLGRISANAHPAFDFDVVMLGWTRSGVDPDPFALFHSSQIPTPASPGLLNFTGFSAPEYDALVIEGRSTYDYGRRKEIYGRTQEIVADQIPYYFLWAQKFGVAAGSKLQGEIDFASPRFLWNVEQWWIR
jgi:peptide/nickel transport system substrate-binding protein